jgi:mannose-1-phosphate guanylyltransferase
MLLAAAGHGTRLRPLTDRVPKAMVPVGGMPVIEHNLRLVRRHGVDEVIINLHAHPDAIPAYVGDGSRWGLHVVYSQEEHLLGTAGAVKRMEHALDGETFAVIYADNLSALLALHQRMGAVATLALHVPEDPRASGIVDVDERGRVRGFVEKPRHYDAVLGVWANAGIYILEPSVLRKIPPGVPYDFGHDLFPGLLAQGHPLYAAPVCTYFLAIDTPERYAAAQAFFARR